MGIALFDLDRTLIDVNSGHLWVREEWRSGNIGMRQAAWAGWWLMRYRFGMVEGLDRVFDTAARSVQGASEAEVDSRVRGWFEREVQHRLRPGGEAAIRAHREAGDRLVLATSGTLYAARAAAAAFGLDEVVCTELEVEDGRFTGGVSVLAVGQGKLRAVAAWAAREGVDLEQATFYTDSYTDITLLEAVGNPVVVNPDGKLRRAAVARGWPVVDWGPAPERAMRAS